MNCSRCKRSVSNNKYYHAAKKLCIYCYNLQYETVPCISCFQLVERKHEDMSKVLCQICRLNPTSKYCSRTSFDCADCSYIHSLWCPSQHSLDMGVSSKILEKRRSNKNSYLSSRGPKGYYQWSRFLFCSTKCVQRLFEKARWCVLCGHHTAKLVRCRNCNIALCGTCSSQWFFQNQCRQCFVDTHTHWPIQILNDVLPVDIPFLESWPLTSKQYFLQFLS